MHDTHETLTDTDKAELLKMAGLTPEHEAAFTTPAPVIEILGGQHMPVTRKRHATVTQKVNDGLIEHGLPAQEVSEYDTIATELLTKAKGNLDTAKQLSENWAKVEFDKTKLSKVQAAALGLDEEGKKKHNKDEWARVQRMRENINTAMRRQSRGYVRSKIAANKEAASNPQLDAFLLANQGNPLIEQLIALQNGGN